MLRQQGLEVFPQQAGQHRALPPEEMPHHQRRAIDERRHDEAGRFGSSTTLAKDPRLIGALVTSAFTSRRSVAATTSHLPVSCCGANSPASHSMLPLAASSASSGSSSGRDHGELGTGIQQQARLALCYLAAADQQHGFVVESAKMNKVPMGLLIRRFGLAGSGGGLAHRDRALGLGVAYHQ